MRSFLVFITKKHLGDQEDPFKSLPFGSESHAWHIRSTCRRKEKKKTKKEEEEGKKNSCRVLTVFSSQAPFKREGATKHRLRFLCPNQCKRRHGRPRLVEGGKTWKKWEEKAEEAWLRLVQRRFSCPADTEKVVEQVSVDASVPLPVEEGQSTPSVSRSVSTNRSGTELRRELAAVKTKCSKRNFTSMHMNYFIDLWWKQEKEAGFGKGNPLNWLDESSSCCQLDFCTGELAQLASSLPS